MMFCPPEIPVKFYLEQLIPQPFMIDLLEENTSGAAVPQRHVGVHCLVESSSPRARKEPALLLQGSPNHRSRCRTKYLCYIFCAHATASAPSPHLPVTPSVPVRHSLKKGNCKKVTRDSQALQ